MGLRLFELTDPLREVCDVDGAVSAEMAKQGSLNERGRPFNHKSVASMLAV